MNSNFLASLDSEEENETKNGAMESQTEEPKELDLWLEGPFDEKAANKERFLESMQNLEYKELLGSLEELDIPAMVGPIIWSYAVPECVECDRITGLSRRCLCSRIVCGTCMGAKDYNYGIGACDRCRMKICRFCEDENECGICGARLCKSCLVSVSFTKSTFCTRCFIV